MYKQVQNIVKTSTNWYEAGVTPLIVLVALAVSSLFVAGGGIALSSIKGKNIFDRQLADFSKSIYRQSSYLDAKKVDSSLMDGSVVGTVILPDGSFSVYRLIDGPVSENGGAFDGEVKVQFLSGDYGIGSYSDGTVAPFYLKDGTKTVGVIMDRVIVNLEYQGTNYAFKILEGTVKNGKLIGNFAGQTYNTGYLITGRVDEAGHISGSSVTMGASKASEAEISIAVNALALFKSVSEVINPKVLAAATESPVGYKVLGFNKPIYDLKTGRWAFASSNIVTPGTISTLPTQNVVNYIQNLAQLESVQVAQGSIQSLTNTIYQFLPSYLQSAVVTQGITDIKSTNSKLTVTTSDNVATLALDLSGISSSLSDGQVSTSKIADGAVTSAKIEDNTVTATDLSSTLTFGSTDLIDLSAITHSSTSKQGLMLPNVSSSSPSNPSSGEGYLAYDTSGDQVIFYNGSSWGTVGAGTITSVNAGNGLSGGGSSGAVSLAVNTTDISSCTSSSTQKIIWDSTNNRFTCGTDQTTGGSASSLSSITDALTTNTLSNGDLAQTWNWSLTTASKTAFKFGESSASTATGTPYILGVSTLTASTANPLLVTAGGTSNGIKVDTTGLLSAIGTGGIRATDIASGTYANALTLSSSSNVFTGTIGQVTPLAGSFTSLSATGTLSASNFSGSSSGSNTGDQTITLTGDVTGSGTGSFAATIGSGAVTLGKMANLAANSIVGNNTGVSATPIALTTTQVKSLLAIANTDVSGLGTMSTQNANSVSITGGSLSGLTSVAATTFTGALTGNASSVTNATLTTGLTVNTGTVTLSGNVANTSVLTIGAGAVTVSGTNTGDNAVNSNYSSDYRAANFIAGTNYLTPTGSAAGLTSFPTLNQSTTGTAANITGVLSATSFPAMLGDVTNTQGSLTNAISSGAVTLAKMANLAANSIIGNNTGISATPIALTTTQVKSLLAIANTDVSGLGTMSTQNANAVSITGGSLSGLTSVGATTFTGALSGNATTATTATTGNALANTDTAGQSAITAINSATTGTINIARLNSSVTTQGNTFNGISQLVQLNASGNLPALNGAALTGITGDQVLPSQTGNNGKVLGTNGTTVSWVTNSSGVAWGAITGTLTDQSDLNTALGGKLSTTLTSANIFVGNVSNVATGVAMSGDVTIDNTGLTAVGSGKITLAKMANLAANSIIGNNTGVSATPIALTTTQVKSLLAIANTDVSGLGTMSTQNANAVSITGGSLSGLTSVGATTFTGALTGDVSGNAGTVTNGIYSTGSYADPGWITSLSPTKVLPDQTGNNGKVLGTNGTTVSWTTNSSNVAWGAITGTLSSQSDLNTALGGKLSTTLTSANILVGNVSNVATGVAMSGDVTIDNTGLTAIGASKITLAKMADLAANSIIGNNTGVGATPIALTTTQVKSLLAIANTDVSGLGTMSTQNANGVAITGGTLAGITGLGIRSSGTGAFDLTIANTENLTTGRTLTITTGDAARTLTLTGDASIAGTNTGDNAANSNYSSDYRAGNFIAGTNYLTPTGSAAGLTSFPTLNQSTTGTAANITGVLSATSFPAMLGDVTNTQGSLTNAISSGAVTLAKMADMATASFLGRNTAGIGAPEVLSATTAKTILAIANTDVSGLGTMSTQNANGVTITGGTINGTSVGATTVSTGAFSTLSATGAITGATATNTINGIIINSGAVSGVSTLGLSGAITGATATNTINGLIINSGALSGITTINASGQFTSTVTTGTAPFVVASTTNVANLNASSLGGATFAAPGSIGGGTAAAGTFTTLTGNTSVTDVGLSTAGVVTNTSGGLLGTLAGTTTTVLHGNAAGAPTFASISGSDLAANITISTTGNISTTSTGTITSAGVITGPIATNTINGIVINSGAITTGTWSATAIGATKGGTGQTGVTTGDLLYGSATDTWSRLADVATGSCLNSGGVGAAPAWGSCGAGGGISTVQEGGVNKVTSAGTLNFAASDFVVTDETGGVAGVAIDFANAKIVQKSNSSVTFDAGITFNTTGNTNGITLNTATGASGNSGNITIQTGGTTTSGTSGNVIIDVGAGAAANGTISIGGTNSGTITIGRSTQGITLPGFTGNNAVLYGTTGTGVLAAATTSSSGLCLVSGAAAGYAPTWTTCPGGGGSLDTAYNSGGTITVDAYDVLLNLSDATNDYKFTIDNATTGNIATAFAITSTGVGGTTGVGIDLSDADIVTALALGSNDITLGGVTISSAEFSLLDGHDVALVDTNDAVSTSITGVGTLGSLTVSGAISGATATNTINGLIISSGALSGITTIDASGQFTSTVTTGTAPFVVASTTNVANLNASSLGGATFAAPGAIGGTTPGTGAFTTLSASGLVSANGGLTLAANQNLTFTSGTGALTQNYSNTTGTQATFNHTNSGSSGTNTSTAISIPITGTINGTGSNTITGINFPNVAAATNNTYNGITFGTGFNNYITSGTVNLTAAGALSGLTTLGLSGAISGATATNTINGIIINSGAVSGISTINASGQITSTVTTGTAPLVVASTTNVANLNAASLNGATFAAPGAIGGGTPSTGAFTTLTSGAQTITATTANSLAVGRQGITNPVLNIDASTATVVTGLNIKGAAAAGGLALTTTSSGVDENLTIDAKGAGTITLNGTGTGTVALGRNTTIAGTLIITSNSASAFEVGPNGTTNPSLNIDSSTASSVTGLNVKSAVSGGGLALSIISSGTNEPLTIGAKGSGAITLASGSTGDINFFTTSNKITSAGALTIAGGISAPSVTNTINSLIINAGALSGVTGLTFSSGNISGAGTVGAGATTITSATATALTVGANGSTNPVLQIDASTASVATGLKVLGAATGGTTALSVIDSGTNTNLSISAKGSGTITLASGSTGNIQFFSSSNTITSGGNLSIAGTLTIGTSGAIYATAARPTRQITLTPEFPGAVLTGSGSSNTGTMTSDFCAASAGVVSLPATNTSVCNTSGDTHDYYNWANAQGTAQSYDIWIKWRVPDNFSAWAASNPVKVYAKTNDVTNGQVKLYIYDTANTVETNANGANMSTSATAWTQTSVASLGGTYTAGSYMTIRINMNAAATTGTSQVGEINLDYLSSN